MIYIQENNLSFIERSKDSHKGDNGRLLIVGGSESYTGAVALAGLASLRTGTDIVRIASPEKVSWTINRMSPDLITVKLKGKSIGIRHLKTILSLADESDAVLIGNGIGQTADTEKFVKRFVKKCSKPLIIDADAIKMISLKDIKKCLLTPHKKELKIFLENSNIMFKDFVNMDKKIFRVQKLIRDNVILIKGRVDRIITDKGIFYNKTGNEGMSKAGTGDVLAGIAAGFAAQGISLVNSAVNAAYINGRIGDALKSKKGYSFIASDIIDDYKKVFKK